jgi:preprotein translocase subunit SecG
MRALRTTVLAFALLAVAAPAALAHDGGEGLWGETNDKVITNAGFILIAFFPLFIFVMSMLQWRLDKRKDARKRAAKARTARADVRGGW